METTGEDDGGGLGPGEVTCQAFPHQHNLTCLDEVFDRSRTEDKKEKSGKG